MLKQALMVKQVVGATDLSLEAKSGESLLVKDILIYDPVTSYVTIKTEKTTVGYFRVGGNLGNHLPIPIGSPGHSHGVTVAAADGALTEDHALSNAFGISNANLAITSDLSALTTVDNMVAWGNIPAVAYESLLKYLGRTGIFKGFPIAEGETMTITGANQASSIQIVLYEQYHAADIVNTQENGSASKIYTFINYGRTAAVLASSVSTLYNVIQSPAEFPDFPYGKVVPANTKITLYGVLATDIVNDLGSNDTMQSSYIKLIKDRTTLFDDDKNGLLMYGIIGNTDLTAQYGRGISLIGNKSDKDIKPPFMFPTPIEFLTGDELNVYITTIAGASYSASSLAVADTEIGLILKVERAGA